jgi:hypothetical protein
LPTGEKKAERPVSKVPELGGEEGQAGSPEFVINVLHPVKTVVVKEKMTT